MVLLVGTGAAGASQPRSGIAGKIVEGPTCPVQSVPPQPQCAPRPLQARVRISRVASHRPARVVRSDSTGHFTLRLTPGSYVVQGLPTSRSGLPRPPAPERVRVYPGRLTRITLNYDTGIR